MPQLRSASDIGLKDYIHIKKAERAAQPFLCSKTIRQVANAPALNVPELFLSEKTKKNRPEIADGPWFLAIRLRAWEVVGWGFQPLLKSCSFELIIRE